MIPKDEMTLVVSAADMCEVVRYGLRGDILQYSAIDSMLVTGINEIAAGGFEIEITPKPEEEE